MLCYSHGTSVLEQALNDVRPFDSANDCAATNVQAGEGRARCPRQ